MSEVEKDVIIVRYPYGYDMDMVYNFAKAV